MCSRRFGRGGAARWGGPGRGTTREDMLGERWRAHWQPEAEQRGGGRWLILERRAGGGRRREQRAKCKGQTQTPWDSCRPSQQLLGRRLRFVLLSFTRPGHSGLRAAAQRLAVRPAPSARGGRSLHCPRRPPSNPGATSERAGWLLLEEGPRPSSCALPSPTQPAGLSPV